MAKAKKSGSGSGESSEAGKKPAAASKKSKAAKPAAKPTVPVGAPLIDTSLAASSAAKMLLAGANKPAAENPSEPAPPQPESAMFKQLKAGLNKPHSNTMSNLLDKSQGPQSANKGHSNFRQVGRNQTFGADATRSGVPRRTPG